MFVRLLLSIAALAAAAPATCAPPDGSAPPPGAQKRPRIGLVLGGGSARGFAHIGVIEWLEEHHIPVDCVAGTSMGGLMAGLYAMGQSPQDIRRIIAETDWDEAFRGEPAYDQLILRRQEDKRAFPNRISVGLKGGLNFASGLDPAHPIGLLLSRVSLPYSTVKSFDDLPIPFRCVATDIVAGKSVTLKDGPPAEALRATMAIPGIFTPVQRGKMLLVDGGILKNLPTDAVKEMGADIIIAVDVGGPMANRKELNSLLGILGQTVAVVMAENVRRSLLDATVVIEPQLGKYTGDDYSFGNQIADAGYQSADRKAAALAPYAVSDREWEEYIRARRARMAPHRTIVPTFIDITPPNVAGSRTIRSSLWGLLNKPLSLPRLENDLTTLTGSGRYESLRYGLEERSGREGLLVTAVEKSNGPPFLNLGIDLQGAEPDRIQFNLASRITAFDVGSPGSEWRTDLSLGSHNLVSTEYYRRLGPRGWFVAPRAFYDHNSLDYFQGTSRLAEYRVESIGAAVPFGYEVARNARLQVQYQICRISSSVRTGEQSLPSWNGTASVASARYVYDGRDSPIVPTRGVRFEAEGRHYLSAPGAPHPFIQATADFWAFAPTHRKEGLTFLRASGGLTLDHSAPFLQQFRLGGPLQLGAYARDEVRGSNFILLAAGLLRRVGSLPPIVGGKIYAGGWYEFGTAFEALDGARHAHSLTLGVVGETLLGPFFVGGAVGDQGQARFYFSLGRLF